MIRKISAFVLSSLLIFSFSLPAFANSAQIDSTDEFTLSQLKEVIQSLNEEYKEKTSLTINESDLTEEYLQSLSAYDNEELVKYLTGFYEEAANIEYKVVDIKTVPADPGTITPFYTTYLNRECTIFSGIPSGGVSWIHIRYNALIGDSSDGRKHDGLFYGGRVLDSWQTGTAVGQWKHQTGNFRALGNQAEVTATGLLTYGIPNTPLSVTTQETFLFTDSIHNY